MELWKRCRIGLLLLAMLCLVTGCSPIDWKTAADTSTAVSYTHLDVYKRQGLERLTMQLIGEDNVRETTLFPRDLSRLEP